MKKILITGKNSYIGSSLRKHLESHTQGYIVDELDMLNENWADASFSGYDAIVHVAGLVHKKQKQRGTEILAHYMRVNCDLAIRCAEKAKKEGVSQFIFLSTMSLYQQSKKIGTRDIIDEHTKPHPTTYYGMSKMLAEQGLQALQSDSFNVAILRPPMVYGANCPGNYRALMLLALKCPLFPKINNMRSMLYIGNLCEFVRHLIDDCANGCFFPQNAEYVNTCHMVALIARAHGKNTKLLPGFTWLFKVLACFSTLPGKVFGDMVYDQKASRYHKHYQIYTFEESIRLTELS